MASRSYRLPSPYERTPLPRRLSGWALAIGLELLLVFILLGLGIRTLDMAPTKSGPVMIDIGPRDDDQAQPQPDNPQPKPPTPPVIPPITSPIPPIIPSLAPPPPPPQRPSDFIEMSPADMAAGDIATVPKSGRSAGDSQEVGRGPNGEAMYAAQWVREPTDAELSGYMPRNPRSGYGMVACKTAPGNRVEDCVELENVPRGTRLASTLRQAAWQFKVRPPRKGGKPLIGAWVRIRFDFTNTSEEGGE